MPPPTDDPLDFLEQSISKLFRRYATDEQKKVQLTIVLIRCDYTDETQHILEEVNKANCELISVFRTYFRKQLSPEKLGGFDAADLANLLGTAMVGAIYQSLRFPSDYRLDKHGVRAISQVFTLIRRASLSGRDSAGNTYSNVQNGVAFQLGLAGRLRTGCKSYLARRAIRRAWLYNYGSEL